MLNSKKSLVLAIAIASSFAATSAFAEDRATAGYNLTNDTANEWFATAEKNVFVFGAQNALYVNGGVNQLVGGDATYTVGGGVEYALTQNFLVKAGADYNYAESADEFVTYRAGLVFQNNDLRVAGSAVKAESQEVFGEVTAEYTFWKGLGVGVGGTFDKDEYRGSQVFVSYIF